jgi:hypothetical protein
MPSIFSRSPSPPLRYYLYISDTKLDMLFEQVDQPTRRRISKEIRVDLKLASFTFREPEDSMPSRLAKLRIVEQYIGTYHNVGNVAEPGSQFFRGQLDMQWGRIGDEKGVWFQSIDFDTGQFVALGGSRYHILGEQKPNFDMMELQKWYFFTSLSTLPGIVEALADEVTSFHDLRLPTNFRFQGKALVEESLRTLAAERRERIDVDSQYGTHYSQEYTIQRLDFLAIPLLEMMINIRGYSIHTILGTPLYIALA